MTKSLSSSDNPMIDYNRSLDRKGFVFDLSIPKFGINYDRNKQQKGCVVTRLPGHILNEFLAKNSTRKCLKYYLLGGGNSQ